jgi:hypothetical protein
MAASSSTRAEALRCHRRSLEGLEFEEPEFEELESVGWTGLSIVVSLLVTRGMGFSAGFWAEALARSIHPS